MTHKTPADPRAIELAALLLKSADFILDDVQMFTWMAKAHFLTTQDGRKARLLMAGHGEYSLGFEGFSGEYNQGIIEGHIEQTPVGSVARQRALETGRAITGQVLELRGWVDFSGIVAGRHMVPADRSSDHSFLMLEINETDIAMILGDNPSDSAEAPTFQREPFLQLAAARFMDPRVDLACSINITDEEAFCSAMGVISMDDITPDVLREKMTVLGGPLEAAGLTALSCASPRSEFGFFKFDVQADVEDFGTMTAFARECRMTTDPDESWYPASPEEAIWEIALASNKNPSPDLMGFEFVAQAEALPREEPEASCEDEAMEP